MKIVIASDSFKGSLSAKEVGEAIARGIKKSSPSIETVNVPMADGGEGTVSAMVDATKGCFVEVEALDPLGRKATAVYGLLSDGETAVIEVASVIGLPLLSLEERDPDRTSTYGIGEMILDAMERGCKRFIIGLGGSSTNDGGVGMLKALGARFCDQKGNALEPRARELKNLRSIDLSGLDPRLFEASFRVACDVENTICGPQGASKIFGPQKGADDSLVLQLEEALKQYAAVLGETIGSNLFEIKGGGAAGGLGVAFHAVLGAELERGVEIVKDVIGLERHLEDAQLVITGEGRMDGQTVFGKTPHGVARSAKKYGLPVIGIAGGLGADADVLYGHGFDALFGIADAPMRLEESMGRSGELLEKAGRNIVQLIQMNLEVEK
ncbi:glycerate kinase [Anaerotalea alkaliphila]|uniref:Glycerate kinase n=1 Tax=Anaerotalea alkaliphila TaxID=2662126 RepID=A0A7X5KP90_9FIRM|nr:glycerate kinase [Anaerotalea alkaliphila]